jgi:hypothetical protein
MSNRADSTGGSDPGTGVGRTTASGGAWRPVRNGQPPPGEQHGDHRGGGEGTSRQGSRALLHRRLPSRFRRVAKLSGP